MMKTFCIVLLATIGGIIHASEEGAMVPRAERLAGVWVGFGESGMPFFRLQLDSDGTGYLALAENRMPGWACRIKQWSLQGTNITFSVATVIPQSESTNAVRYALIGHWHGMWASEAIVLERKGSGLTDRAALRKEDDLWHLTKVARRGTDEARAATSKP